VALRAHAGTYIASEIERQMIRFENVRKTYPVPGGLRVVLRGCSFEVPDGRNLAVIGPNGAGKSTLIRMIAGSELPDSGRITRKGRFSWPLGFSGGLHKSLTGRQNTRFMAKIFGCDADELVKFVQDFAEIGLYFDQPISAYSSGMRARVSFGICMGIRFDTYLIDEGMATGDQRFKQKYTEVFEARRSETNVLMVAHQPGTLREYCDTGAVLWNGELEFFPTVDEALHEYDRLVRSQPAARRG
jgi:capsular polysaccharide transport system ATP-binding protein